MRFYSSVRTDLFCTLLIEGKFSHAHAHNLSRIESLSLVEKQAMGSYPKSIRHRNNSYYIPRCQNLQGGRSAAAGLGDVGRARSFLEVWLHVVHARIVECQDVGASTHPRRVTDADKLKRGRYSSRDEAIKVPGLPPER